MTLLEVEKPKSASLQSAILKRFNLIGGAFIYLLLIYVVAFVMTLMVDSYLISLCSSKIIFAGVTFLSVFRIFIEFDMEW